MPGSRLAEPVSSAEIKTLRSLTMATDERNYAVSKASVSHLKDRRSLRLVRCVHRDRQLAEAIAKSKRLTVADDLLLSGLRDECLFELPALV